MELLVAPAALAALGAILAAGAYLRSRGRWARKAPDGMQESTIVVRERYRPSVIVARCGVPLRLRFTRDEEAPCSEKVIFPDFGVSRSLPAHRTTIVELMPANEGEFLFTCALGMYQGTLIVRRQPKAAGMLRRDRWDQQPGQESREAVTRSRRSILTT
jgi:plastocyanin domain-containing protein